MSSILKNPSSKFSKTEKYNNKKVVAGLVNDLKIQTKCEYVPKTSKYNVATVEIRLL